MKKNIILIIIASIFALGVLTLSNMRTERVMQNYDSCYEQYVQYHIPAEAFNQFMSNCK